MADRLEHLLKDLLQRQLVNLEQRDVLLTASPRTPGDVLEADQSIARKREEQRVAELQPAFESGLRRAYQAHRAGQPSVAFDDQVEDENRMAEALIQFLVRLDLAGTHTEQLEGNHYIYHITVDWPKLRERAGAAGIDIDAELSVS